MSSDIVVIGAGIAGASIAAQLSAHGKVTLLEMEKNPGFHATGRSAAYYAPSYGNDVVRGITVASEAFFREPKSEFSTAQLLKPRPSIFVADKDQTNTFKAFMDENPNLKCLDSKELRQRVPLLKPGILVQGAMDTVGGDLDVDAILQGFLRQFLGFGGVLHVNAKVQSLKYQHGFWKIDTDAGHFSAPVIVNAAGAWADQLAELAGLKALGLQALKRTAILVDAVDYIADWPLVVDVDETFYFKPDAGQLLLSPADETPSAPCDAFAEEITIAVTVDRIQKVLDIEVRKVNHSWAGLRTFSPDKTFIVGFDPRCEGFFWLAGQGGYGVQTCPALADIAAHQITGSHNIVTSEEVEKYNAAMQPERFL